MKKIFALMLALCMVFALCACGAKTEAPAPAPAETPAEAPAEAPVEEAPKTDFPQKSIRVLCGFAAGGSNDLFTRAMCDAANKYLPNGQVMYVENITGASGTIAATEVFSADPDGYTLMGLGSGVVCAQPLLIDTVYKPGDFTYIMSGAQVPAGMMVPIDAPYSTVEEWVNWCKENPGEFTIALPGKGTPAHVAVTAVAAASGIEINYVFYNGDSEGIPQMLGGFAQGYCSQETSMITYVESGQAKMLFTTGDAGYFGGEYDVSKYGYNVQYYFSNIFMGPPDMPAEVTAILHDAFKAAIDNGDVDEAFANLGLIPSYVSGEDLKETILKDYELNKQVLKEAGIEVNE